MFAIPSKFSATLNSGCTRDTSPLRRMSPSDSKKSDSKTPRTSTRKSFNIFRRNASASQAQLKPPDAAITTAPTATAANDSTAPNPTAGQLTKENEQNRFNISVGAATAPVSAPSEDVYSTSSQENYEFAKCRLKEALKVRR